MPAIKAVGIKEAVQDLLRLYGLDSVVRIATPEFAPAHDAVSIPCLRSADSPGQTLRAARTSAGMTQAALASAIGVQRHHISEMEHDKRPIGRNMASRMGHVFHMDGRIFL